MHMIPAAFHTSVNDYLMPGQSQLPSVPSFNYVYFIFVRYLFWQQHSPLSGDMSFVLCRLLSDDFHYCVASDGPRFAFKFAHYSLTPASPASPTRPASFRRLPNLKPASENPDAAPFGAAQLQKLGQTVMSANKKSVPLCWCCVRVTVG